MKTIIIISCLVTCLASSALQPDRTIKLNYEPKGPKLYFASENIWIETDTASFMKIIKANYSSRRIEEIRTEIAYRIRTATGDSVRMDGPNLNLYTNEARTSYEAGVLKYSEVWGLIKKGLVKLSYKDSGQPIKKVYVKKEGSKKTYNIDEVYYDAETNQEIDRINLYRKQY